MGMVRVPSGTMTRTRLPLIESWDAASVTKINKWLGLQLAISDRYVSNPPIVGTKSNDVIFSTGINFAFAH